MPVCLASFVSKNAKKVAPSAMLIAIVTLLGMVNAVSTVPSPPANHEIPRYSRATPTMVSASAPFAACKHVGHSYLMF